MTNLVLLSVFLSTNVPNKDSWYALGAVPPIESQVTTVFTNYVFGIMDGTNKIELLTTQRERLQPRTVELSQAEINAKAKDLDLAERVTQEGGSILLLVRRPDHPPHHCWVGGRVRTADDAVLLVNAALAWGKQAGCYYPWEDRQLPGPEDPADWWKKDKEG